VTFNNTSNSFSGSFTGSGAALTGLNGEGWRREVFPTPRWRMAL
jgi:hypothetical protein